MDVRLGGNFEAGAAPKRASKAALRFSMSARSFSTSSAVRSGPAGCGGTSAGAWSLECMSSPASRPPRSPTSRRWTLPAAIISATEWPVMAVTVSSRIRPLTASSGTPAPTCSLKPATTDQKSIARCLLRSSPCMKPARSEVAPHGTPCISHNDAIFLIAGSSEPSS